MKVERLIRTLRHDYDLSKPIGLMIDGKFTEIAATRDTVQGVILLTSKWENVRVLPGISGRFAVFARVEHDHEWTQVESITSEQDAHSYADDLDFNEEARASAVAETIGEDWDDDAPARPPQK